jgi:translation initiation factor 2 subunit 3
LSKKKKESGTYLRQPEVNIGTLGHVDNGKSTLVQALTSQWTARHSEELKRGITIRIGEACGVYGTEETCSRCGSPAQYLRSVSFVDCPGHHSLMVTMLSGATLMDGALLILSATEPCPQAQDREHLAAAEIVGIDKLVVIQNKIDVVERQQSLENFREIQAFVKGTIAEEAPIIPVSAQRGVNTDLVIEMIEKVIPTPKRELNKPPLMPILRSFDVNKPGTPADEIRGGVIGGSISQGVFKVGAEVEICPGIRVERGGRTYYEPLVTEIVSLNAAGRSVEKVTCGGLIGVGTLLDPALTKADSLVGNIIGRPDNLPPVLNQLSIEVELFERAIGTKDLQEVQKIRTNEALVLNAGTAVTAGVVTSARNDVADISLRRPICTEANTRVAVSRRIGEGWRLIGFGKIR